MDLGDLIQRSETAFPVQERQQEHPFYTLNLLFQFPLSVSCKTPYSLLPSLSAWLEASYLTLLWSFHSS